MRLPVTVTLGRRRKWGGWHGCSEFRRYLRLESCNREWMKRRLAYLPPNQKGQDRLQHQMRQLKTRPANSSLSQQRESGNGDLISSSRWPLDGRALCINMHRLPRCDTYEPLCIECCFQRSCECCAQFTSAGYVTHVYLVLTQVRLKRCLAHPRLKSC
jgi:hypothetical protein